jgi:hypothetical protein
MGLTVRGGVDGKPHPQARRPAGKDGRQGSRGESGAACRGWIAGVQSREACMTVGSKVDFLEIGRLCFLSTKQKKVRTGEARNRLPFRFANYSDGLLSLNPHVWSTRKAGLPLTSA